MSLPETTGIGSCAVSAASTESPSTGARCSALIWLEASSVAVSTCATDSTSGNASASAVGRTSADKAIASLAALSSPDCLTGSASPSALPRAGGKTRGSTLPSRRMASATLRKALTSQAESSPAAISRAQRPKPSKAWREISSKGLSIGFCSASHALSSCSMDQAASPKLFSPTMRELPFRVWNALRKVVCSLKSPGAACKADTAPRPFSTTSRASSRKISSSSSSTSGPRT